MKFKNKKLQRFWLKGIKKGINNKIVDKLLYLLFQLNYAESSEDMNIVGYDLHALKGSRAGFYAVTVTANYRLTFKFVKKQAVDVNLEDYH